MDDQEEDFPTDLLTKFKNTHEEWVRTSLQDYDEADVVARATYASYAESWVQMAMLDDFRDWTSPLLSHGQPSIRVDHFQALAALREWLLIRIWPGTLPDLEDAFQNFRAVLVDLMEVFSRHSEEHGSELWTAKFYKIQGWDPDQYHALADDFDYHVDLVEDLALELTRATNYVCDAIRTQLDPTFRLEEGAVATMSGPNMDLRFTIHRAEYRDGERTARPYPGLAEFEEVRTSRDFHFGAPKGDSL